MGPARLLHNRACRQEVADASQDRVCIVRITMRRGGPRKLSYRCEMQGNSFMVDHVITMRARGW